MGTDNKSENANFRQKAEELIKTNASKSGSLLTNTEMQNEEPMSALSDRKRADESLIDSKSHLQTLLQTIPDLIWLKDSEGVYLSCNTRFERLFGAREADVIGKTDYDFVDRDLADFFRENDRKAIEAGEPTSNEEWVTFAEDGHREFLDTIKTPMYDFNGKLIGVLGIGRDITERKKAEDALLESEIKYRAFFENSMDAILLTSPDGKILSANQASCDMFGYPEDELMKLGRSGIADMSDPRLSVLLDERKRNGKARGEVTLLRKDGTRFPADISSVIFKNREGSEHTSMIIRDISERRKTEKEIMNLAKFPSENPNPILRISQNGTLLYVNEAGMKQLPDWKLQTEQSAPTILQSVVFNTLNIGEVQVAEFEHIGKIYSFYAVPFVEEGYANLYGWDITERRQAEEKLRESEFRFQQVSENARELIWEVDIDGLYTYSNPVIKGLLGYEPEEIIGKKHFYDLFDQENREELKQAALGVFARKESFNNFVNINLHKDGRKIILSTSGIPILDNLGNLIGYRGVDIDITDRIHAKETLLILSSAVEQTGDSIMITNREGTIEYVNHAFEILTGYTSEEAVGKTPRILKSGSGDKEYYESMWKIILSGKIFRAEVVNKKKNGDLYNEEKTISPIFNLDKTITHFIATGVDITERKKIQNELKFQANLLNNVGQAVIATDLSGNVIYWNNAAETIYGWSSAEAMGQNITSITPAQTTLEQAAEIMKKLSEGDSWTGEFQMERKDGSNFPAMVTDAPFLNSKEELAGVIGISSDITERKRAEQDLIIANKELVFQNDEKEKRAAELIIANKELVFQNEEKENRAAELIIANKELLFQNEEKEKRATELVVAKEHAEESDRLKSAFLANMSHEVRTPLNSIIGFSELLTDPDFDEYQKNEFIQHIIAGGNNLLTIISDIMDISKMESGEITIRKKPINAHEYVLGIYEQFSFQAETHKLEFGLNLPDNDNETEIFADAERLRQIFNNLIGNAFKFTANGSIEIGYRLKGEMVEFFVKDTGIGIPASYHHKIFDRFRQVEDEKTRKYGGNGLGLAITKNLVKLMGEKIWVESNEGKGSAFYFTMPVYSGKLE